MERIKILVDKTLDEDTALILSEYADVEIMDTSNLKSEKLFDVNVLCIRTNTIINKEYLENTPKLKIIATATTGTNHIDIRQTGKRGIAILDAKGANADSVADYVFRILFEVTDDAYYTNKILRENPNLFLKLKKENKRRELGSLSIGIIGLGNVGSRVARRAKAFGMDVKAYDPYVSGAENTLEEVLGCDIVSVHAELTDETRGMMTYDVLSMLREDVIFINAARAEIIEEEALNALLSERKNMHAIIDVFRDEPMLCSIIWIIAQ
jgi:D-3-phosphoglycerate dehydrogenase / 2-oxoglutarate reductase